MADNTGAAFGVFPQMRPRRARQDREAAANAPLSALRGWAAGTAGLPGDIEGLLRMLTPGVSNEPTLPTSEFYKEWLPGRSLNETPTGRAFTEAGSLTGGAGLGPLSRLAAGGANVAGRGAMAAGRAGERLAERLVPQVIERNGMGAQLLRDLSQGSGANVIKPKGGNWLAGSVEDSLKGLKTPGYRHINDQGYSVAEGFGRPMTAEELVTRGPQPHQEALNNWIDKQLTRYVKNDMATEKDPVRALAERGVLHYAPEVATPGQRGNAAMARAAGGYSVGGDSVSDLAQAYELMTDSAIRGESAANWRRSAAPDVLSRIPGFDRIPDEAMVYERTSPAMTENLGFNHLIDELRNATNPDSGLPLNLQIKPESLQQLSVPQAVERVAKINEWREAQKAEANLAKANNAATVTHKEYPDKGYKWVELKEPGVNPDKGLYDAEGTYKSLGDALKYEGDTMGHCVGRHCPDVVEGRSRIYSLRDAKGQPHVTVEVKPGRLSGKMNLEDWAARYEGIHGQGSSASYLAEHPEIEQAFVPEIAQIKGKGNRAPNPEYLPYVQDFVKSGKWSDVRDLQNTGLLSSKPMFHPDDISKYRNRGEQVGDYLAEAEYQRLLNMQNEPGFAAGGLVQNTYNQAKIDALAQQLQEELYA